MTGDQPSTPGVSAAGGPRVMLTRRRWDWYFVPALLTAAALGLFAAVATGEVKTVLTPVPVALLWWWVRVRTPREGMLGRRLSSQPDLLRLMGWFGFMLVLALAVVVGDSYVTGRDFRAPYEAYHLALLGPILVAFIVGTLLFARRIDRQRETERRQAANGAAAEV